MKEMGITLFLRISMLWIDTQINTKHFLTICQPRYIWIHKTRNKFWVFQVNLFIENIFHAIVVGFKRKKNT